MCRTPIRVGIRFCVKFAQNYSDHGKLIEGVAIVSSFFLILFRIFLSAYFVHFLILNFIQNHNLIHFIFILFLHFDLSMKMPY